MILVIGGFASGKRAYVKREYGYDDCDMADGILDDKPVLFNLQDLVASRYHAADELLEPLLKKPVVVCNEVGCGVVLVSVAERAVREATGRLCIALAANAQRVVRVQCGIPVVLKG